MRIRKTHSLDIPASVQRDVWLDAREVADLSRGDAPEAGTEKIHSAIRDHVAAAGYVNMPLPHPVHDKFLQMTGWRIPEDGAPWQEGWGRVNSFWRRTTEERSRLFELDLPAFAAPQSIKGGVKFLLDGVAIGDMRLLRGAWHKVVLPVESAASGQPFMLAIVADPSPSFDSRRIRFRRAALPSRFVCAREE